jgi:Ribonuclease G/E
MIRIAISVKNAAARIALLDGDILTEYAIWNFAEPGDIGDRFTARLTAKAPAMAGSFADLGTITGFLPDSAGAAALTEGAYFAARITRMAQSGKGPRLAAIAEPCAGKPGLIRQGLGPLADLAARFPNATITVDDYGLIAEISKRCREESNSQLPGRVVHQNTTFDAILEDEIATLAEPSIQLSGGARMHIACTPALTAIDIDAGAATAGNAAKQPSQLALNLALIPELSRQITLRNLAGAILIDFAGMKSAARQKLLPALEAALKSDPVKPQLLGFSHLGFAEITRPRIRACLHEFQQ